MEGTTLAVGVLTTSYPRHPGDYAGCFVEDRVRAMIDGGHHVHVLAAADGDDGTQIASERLTITRLPCGGGGARPLFYGDGAPEELERGGASVWLQAARFWSGLVGAVATHAGTWSRIEAHWLLPSALAAFCVRPDLPLAAYAHAGDVALLERLPLGDGLGRWIARQAVARRAELIFVSADLRARFAARARLAVDTVGRVEHLIPPAALFPPITAASRQAARAQLGLVRPTVISVGRLVPIKCFHTLIAACSEAAARSEAAPQLVIIGDGPERDALRARARQLGVDLRLPGFVPRPALRQWLHAADVFAQTSGRTPAGRTEGMPVAALEAVAVGLPVVATTAGGLRELAAHHAVEIVPVGDEAALAAALARHLVALLGQESVLPS